jgi:hypothetical protein
MSNIKQLDLIADKVADEALQEIHRITSWHTRELESDGDEYNELHNYVMIIAINKLIRKNL